jgi:hypothetical protein
LHQLGRILRPGQHVAIVLAGSPDEALQLREPAIAELEDGHADPNDLALVRGCAIALEQRQRGGALGSRKKPVY